MCEERCYRARDGRYRKPQKFGWCLYFCFGQNTASQSRQDCNVGPQSTHESRGASPLSDRCQCPQSLLASPRCTEKTKSVKESSNFDLDFPSYLRYEILKIPSSHEANSRTFSLFNNFSQTQVQRNILHISLQQVAHRKHCPAQRFLLDL